jgi:hypothetical protein
MQTWTTHNIEGALERREHICRNCIRKRYALAGGKAAAEAGKTNGQIRTWIMAAASPEARLKAYATARAKGKRCFTSKVEDAVYEKCCEWFGEVERWRFITRDDGRRCNVDLYIPSLKTYVEVDGRYWHGLTKPYEELSPEIKAKYDNDRELDAHCQRIGIRLVRIIDNQVEAGDWSTIERIIRG